MSTPNTPRQRQYHAAVLAQQHNISVNLQDTLFTTPAPVAVADGKQFFDLPPKGPLPRQQPYLFPNNTVTLLSEAPVGVQAYALPPRGKRREAFQLLTTSPFAAPNLLPPQSQDFDPLPSGISGLLLFDTDFAAVSNLAGPIVPLSWRTRRYENRMGSWEATIAVDDQYTGTTPSPIHTQIRRGWHVCIIQENNHPNFDTSKEYLLYMGVVLEREYNENAEGTAVLRIAGNFRGQHLGDRIVHGTKAYANTSISLIAEQLVNSTTYIGSPGGVITPVDAGNIESIAFTNLTRYAALLRLAEHARYALRESWDFDQLELVPFWGPPDSGVTLVKMEAYDPGLDDAGEHKLAIIAGEPRIRYDGTGILNRIIPVGTDNPDGELKLNSSDETIPYAIQNATENGETYYYIEDTDSQDEYGIVEHKLIRTDVRNPSDNAATRLASANVLYATAVDKLIRSRSEVFYFEAEIANGANIWALPGDMVRVDYAGYVQSDAGKVVWEDIDNRRMVIVERTDESTPSGVRKVRFVLAAPYLEFPIPNLPGEVPPGGGSGGGIGIVIPPFTPPDEPVPPGGEPTPPWLPPDSLPPQTPPEPPSSELPGSGEDGEGDASTTSGLPIGVLRTNDDVLEYWDGEAWQNFAASLSTSDPGGGRTWLSSS